MRLMDTDRRPCHSVGTDPNPCALAHYRRIVDNHLSLYGPWERWRLAGRDLVSPEGQRISPERLRGLLFREESEARLARLRAKRSQCGRSAVVPARERFEGLA